MGFKITQVKTKLKLRNFEILNSLNLENSYLLSKKQFHSSILLLGQKGNIYYYFLFEVNIYVKRKLTITKKKDETAIKINKQLDF